MDYTSLKKKFGWFTLILFVLLTTVAWLACSCFPWKLIVVLYVFFVFYLTISIGGKRLMDTLGLNPMMYSLASFFIKIVLVVGFAAILIQIFDWPRKTLLLLLVLGYLVAAIFDFLLLVQSSENNKS